MAEDDKKFSKTLIGKTVVSMELPCDVCTDYNCHRNKSEMKNN